MSRWGPNGNAPPPTKGSKNNPQPAAPVPANQKNGPTKPGQPAAKTLGPNGPQNGKAGAVSPTPSRSTTPRMRDPKAGKVINSFFKRNNIGYTLGSRYGAGPHNVTPSL